MTFRVGQKVVCVDAGEIPDGGLWCGWLPNEEIVEGNVYTISELTVYPRDNWPCCNLAGRDRGPLRPWGYARCRFRPLVERKTDIGWARKIVKDVFAKKPVSGSAIDWIIAGRQP